ncbi:condensation domain-containing protein [Streptomyces sp. NPDC051020]|uniref:condensation domain-containing protein n=1 Tax=Streptomyces sp. NPDC051020 TaxID=3155409 RepID=UPI00342D42FB
MTGTRQPLSQGQQALWYLHRLAPESSAYHVMCAVRIVGARRIGADVLARAVTAVEHRHDLLRSTFDEDERGPYRCVHPAGRLAPEIRPADETGEQLRALVRAAGDRPFRLGTDSAFRVVLFDGPDAQVLLVAAHHIATDAASQALLLRELLDACGAFDAGDPLPWEGPATGFAVQVAAEERLLADHEETERLAEFWRDSCRGAPLVLDLPADLPRQVLPGQRGDTVAVPVPDRLAERIRATAADGRTTVFVVLAAAFQALLYRYTAEPEFVIGCPASGRRARELRGTVGYFVNPMVLRASLDDETTFDALLRRTQQRLRDAMNHQEYPFPLLPGALGLARNAARTPVFQTTFTMVATSRLDPVMDLLSDPRGQRVLEYAGLSITGYDLPQQEGQFDLAVEVLSGSGGLTVLFRYSTDLFFRPTVDRLSMHYLRLLDAVTTRPERRIGAIRLTGEEERAHLLALSAGAPAR